MSKDFKQGISTSMDCLHASEDTYEEVMKMVNKNTRVQTPRGTWSWMKVAAVALVAVLVIGTGAYAAVTGVFSNLFGTHGYGDEGYYEEGPIPGIYSRGTQWFDVSDEKATELVGDKVQHVGQTIEHGGYVLTVHDFLADENGVAIAWATFSNENGIGDVIDPYGAYLRFDTIFPDEDGPFMGVAMRVTNPGEKDNSVVLVNRASVTETSAELTFYYASYDCETPEALTWAMNFGEETWGVIDVTVETDAVPVNAPVEAVACGSVDVTPISVRVRRPSVCGVGNLTVNYADGTQQVIVDDTYYNIVCECANMAGDELWIPTALLDTNQIASVNVSMDDTGVLKDYVFTPAE